MSEIFWMLEPSSIRRARRRHACYRQGCDEPIAVGERYLEYLGETPAFQSGHRYHLACARAASLIARERPRWHRPGICRLPYTEQRDTRAQDCECGGEPAPYVSVELEEAIVVEPLRVDRGIANDGDDPASDRQPVEDRA